MILNRGWALLAVIATVTRERQESQKITFGVMPTTLGAGTVVHLGFRVRRVVLLGQRHDRAWPVMKGREVRDVTIHDRSVSVMNGHVAHFMNGRDQSCTFTASHESS